VNSSEVSVAPFSFFSSLAYLIEIAFCRLSTSRLAFPRVDAVLEESQSPPILSDSAGLIHSSTFDFEHLSQNEGITCATSSLLLPQAL